MLIQRIITATLLITFLGVLLWIGGTTLTLSALLISALASHEYFSFSTKLKFQQSLQLTFCNLLIPIGYLAYDVAGLLGGLWLALILVIIIRIISIESTQHQENMQEIFPACILGICYVGFLGGLLVVVANSVSSAHICWLIGSVVAADVFAYVGGMTIRGPKLSPRISPNKTISGAVCGIIGGTVGSLCLGYTLDIAISLNPQSQGIFLSATGILFAAFAIFGDLLESLVKRIYGVKDSGTLLPGHGGILDRIDAILFTSPLLLFLI